MSHDKFDLVIMNPPFSRPTNHEGAHADVPIPTFAAFDTTPQEQSEMSDKLKELTKEAPSHGNAGEASEFVELAHRKVRRDGTVAMVLPLSSISGSSWNGIRTRWRDSYRDIVVVTIAGAGSHESSFSAYTGMAECLLLARHAPSESSTRRGMFVILRQQLTSAVAAELLATELRRMREAAEVGCLEDTGSVTQLRLGDESFGAIIDAPLPEAGPWPLAGIEDLELAKAAYHLQHGALLQVGKPGAPHLEMPVTRTGSLARRGPVHRDINEQTRDDRPRGPFELIKPAISAEPSYPMLWAHNSKCERAFIVEPDSEGQIKSPTGGVTQTSINEKAANIWATATRAHYNLDLQFNAQSLIGVMTERPSIGGRAWPSVIFDDEDHEFPFLLWCNSTLGLLVHWWLANKSQSSRGTITITGIPDIPTLDPRAMTNDQLNASKTLFCDLSDKRFLPFDQIDEDPVRAELDKRLLVDVLGFPPDLCNTGGPIDLIRRKLVREPQIHGGKKSRVVFRESVNRHGDRVVYEGAERRSDR